MESVKISSKIAQIAIVLAVSLGGAVCYFQPKITLKLVQTFGDTDKAWIAEATDIAVGKGGTVYVADKLMQSVDVFDRTGRLLIRVGRKGKGPGEFVDPSYVAYDRGKIAVGDFPFPRIQIFDQKFRLLSTIYTTAPVGGLPDQVKFINLGNGLLAPEICMFFKVTFDRRDNVFLLSEYWATGEVIYVMSRDGMIRTEFSVPEQSKILYIDEEENLYLSANHAQIVKKYKMIYTGF